MLKCNDLTKKYAGGHGVHNISMEICEHDVFALLGPNGSGKSTLIKMFTGLIWPSGGDVAINGHDVHSEHSLALRQVGAVIEWPSFIPYLTARQNLEVLTGARDKNFTKKMMEMMELVKMTSRLDDKVINFSTGMKQRLGLVLTLLPDSRMIILDEPANGLDPNGIMEIRKLIREINRELGITVLLTSHLLGEVEQICDKMAIIHKGRMVACGSIAEILEKQHIIVVIPEDMAAAVNCLDHFRLRAQCPISALERDGEKLTLTADSDCAADINALLFSNGVRVRSIYRETHKLESFFMKITDGATDVE